ncbi:MAG: hypothetical protein ACJA08_000497 [Cyclobacteriaceae bacterium]|jgi:hypothetical protein
MEDIPHYVSIIFISCIVSAFSFLYYAVKQSDKKSNLPTIVLTLVCVWLFIMALATFNKFFLDFESKPPRLMIFGFINLIIMIGLFSYKRTRDYIGRMPITTLTHIHIIRVPVEMVLWWLFLSNMVPEALTFEGANYDILSGITAPFAGIFLVGLRSKSKFAAIVWNLVTLGLLINIVIRAIMATPYFYDVLVFEQPNIAIFYFPYIYLPLFVVPVVLFAHLASLYQLIFLPEDRS